MTSIHFAYTVPRPKSLLRRGLNKAIERTGLPPLHRPGNDLFIPWGKPVRAPHSISFHLLNALKKAAPVHFYSMYERVSAHLKPGDLFIGGPIPAGGFAFDSRPDTDDLLSVTSRTLRGASDPSCRKYLIMPYAADTTLVSWAKDLAEHHCDGIILIGGEIWTRNWERTPFGSIDRQKVCRIDMGIDLDDYPVVKKNFNPKGKRKYLYIGHTAWYKNTQELERIAAAIPNFEGAHIGAGHIAGWKKLADFAELTPSFMTKLAQEYDIFVNTSTADAQVTTVLEQMCFGLTVACTPESGYEYDSLVRLNTRDTAHNVRTLEALQYADEAELFRRAAANREIARTQHSWDRFSESVLSFIGY